MWPQRSETRLACKQVGKLTTAAGVVLLFNNAFRHGHPAGALNICGDSNGCTPSIPRVGPVVDAGNASDAVLRGGLRSEYNIEIQPDRR